MTLAALAVLLHACRAIALSVEIAAEAGPQANAQRAWLQLFAEAGVTNVRIRGARPADEPRVENLGSPERPLLKLYGVLDRRGTLHLPGDRVTVRDRARLKALLERLEADGPERLSEPVGRFDLTEGEFADVFAALTPRLSELLGDDDPPTLRALVDRVARRAPLAIAPGGAAPLAAAPTDLSAARQLSVGAGLALLLRAEGLALVPEKPVGQPVRIAVTDALGQDDVWPIGHKTERSPRETAPILFESLNVEVEGFTLAEAVDAIAPRLDGLPIVWDRFALRRDGIDPAAVQVKLARTRTYYKRVFDRLAIQARLNTKLRIDEAGRPFVLIGR